MFSPVKHERASPASAASWENYMRSMSETSGAGRLFKTLSDSRVPPCFCAYKIETKEPLTGWLPGGRKLCQAQGKPGEAED